MPVFGIGVAIVFAAAILMAVAERRRNRPMKRAALGIAAAGVIITTGLVFVLTMLEFFGEVS